LAFLNLNKILKEIHREEKFRLFVVVVAVAVAAHLVVAVTVGF